MSAAKKKGSITTTLAERSNACLEKTGKLLDDIVAATRPHAIVVTPDEPCLCPCREANGGSVSLHANLKGHLDKIMHPLVHQAETYVTLLPGGTYAIDCGIVAAFPAGFEGQLRPVDDMAALGVILANAGGTPASRVRAFLTNGGSATQKIRHGQIIASLALVLSTRIEVQESA